MKSNNVITIVSGLLLLFTTGANAADLTSIKLTFGLEVNFNQPSIPHNPSFDLQRSNPVLPFPNTPSPTNPNPNLNQI